MKQYTQENLINKLVFSKENDVVFLLGAGCSIDSGCMAAGKLTTEFKKRMYCAKYGINLNDSVLINDERFLEKINLEYPSNMCNPYSYYFESCFPDPSDRAKFIKENFMNISPSYGYLCFANYLIINRIKTIFTTNFDNLIEKSIRKLDESYDFTIETDNVIPMQSSQLNIIKLHGDYNYDCLRNTKDELKSLSQTIINNISKIDCKELVVIGYSGMDESVMNSLKILSEKGIEIIWCSIEKVYNKNDRIDSLLLNNASSGYCFIDGFDILFSKLYTFQKSDNEMINELYKKLSNENFELSIENQPEKMLFNTNVLINNPSCLKIFKSLKTDEIKEFNDENTSSFIMQFQESIYIIGDINRVIEKFHFNLSLFKKVNICDESIPVHKKCKLLKEAIKMNLRFKNIEIFKDNAFLENDKEIKEGLEISVDLFDGKLYLITNVNYFSISPNLNDNIKFQINKLKSNLYAIKNYEKRKELFDKIFGKSLRFEIFDTVVEFSNDKFGNINESIDIYNCAAEPELIVDKNYSVNQIKLLNEYGPRNTLFSNNKIRVGVFCPTDDKPALKNYLNLLITGTNTRQNYNSIIPEYRGFASTFNKQLELEYDALPPFYSNKLLNSDKIDAHSFKEFCIRGIKKLYNEKNVDIVLIYISEKLAKFRTDDIFDLHDAIKLECANRYKTQFLEEKSINSTDDINKKILNLAIGIYTKTIGMSWYPKNYSKDTLFLGMSFGIDPSGITVGCSQMFDGAGRGMQLIISQISDKHRKNQYLSLDEAYCLGVKIRSTYYKTSKVNPLKRIVVHRCNPFKQEEIEGFKKAFEGIEDFDLIQISEYTQFNCYSFKNGRCNGFPVRRGTTIKNSRDEAYVWTDGSVISSEILNGFTYRNNKRGIGRPLKIKKFYGNISINEVVKDLMYLTKMDFNSADIIYSKLPVTIKYSQVVCELLKQGSFADDLISFEYIM